MDSPTSDPLSQFFTPTELLTPNILYTTLGLTADPTTITEQDLKRAYRKSALLSHPDKNVSKEGEEREAAGRRFKQVGFAWAVLGDEGRRKRYDETGRTDESFFAGDREGGWEAYFEAVFQKVDKKLLDEDKARYEGSQEELTDLTTSYLLHSGSLPHILSSIPHSSTTSEPRLITALTGLISSGTVASTSEWEATSKGKGYEKERKKRVREEKKEAGEAEKLAKELGVWEEFYGDGGKSGGGKKRAGGEDEGEASSSKSKKSKKSKPSPDDDEEDTSALAALIQSRQKQRMGAMDALMEKYGKVDAEEEEEEEEVFAGKGRKGGKKAAGKGKGKGKKDAEAEMEGDGGMPTEEEFLALQAKIFNPASSSSAPAAEGSKKRKAPASKGEKPESGGKKVKGGKGKK